MRTWISHRILDLCVLRPSREWIDPGPQVRCVIPFADSPAGTSSKRQDAKAGTTTIESFVHMADGADSEQSVERAELSLSEFDQISRPDWLLLKFPGTSGRAERASRFPTELVESEPEGQGDGCTPISTEVWSWNPPGYGRSDRPATLRRYADAAEAWAMAVLQQRCRTDTRVWICGNSLGCLPAIAIAREGGIVNQWLRQREPVSSSASSVQPASGGVGLFLRNPPDLEPVVLRVAARWKSAWWMKSVTRAFPETLQACLTASQTQVPAVFLMSELDSLVSPDLQQDIHNAYAGDKQVVSLGGLGHGCPIDEEHLPEVKDACAWLWSRTQPTTSHKGPSGK